MMYENAKAAAQAVNAEKMKEVAASQVASANEIPHPLATQLVSPTPSLAPAAVGVGMPHQMQRAAEEAVARDQEAMTLHRDTQAQTAAARLHLPSMPHIPVLNLLRGVDGAGQYLPCLLYTSPSPRDATLSRMPSSA